MSVAIVFGTYNRINYLKGAVESVRNAVGKLPYHIVVIDGGSTDGSREWLASQSDVLLIRQQKPLTGAVRAFNLGFSYAVDNDYEFVCHLNDDAEIVTPNGIEKAVNLLQANPKVGEVAFAFDLYGDWSHDHVNGKPYGNFGVIRREAGMAVAKQQGDPNGRNWWNPIYKTYGADSEFGCWLWKLGWEVLPVKHIQVRDLQAMDELRTSNDALNPDRKDSKIFWDRWREETFENTKAPLKTVIEAAAARFDARPVEHASIEARKELAITQPNFPKLPTDTHVLITGGHGFLGKHLASRLSSVSGLGVVAPSKSQCDLLDYSTTLSLFKEAKPRLVYHLAARVGGIGANQENPVGFFEQNMLMGINVLRAAKESNVQKVVLVGTVCSYPNATPAPFHERDLWNGFPEATNSAYGVAKKALSLLGEGYRKQFNLNIVTAILANLFGPRDNFDLNTSHVIPAIIRKFLDAQQANLSSVTLWGDGTPTREFLYVEDAVTALQLVAEKYSEALPINVGSEHEISIKDLAQMIAQIVGYKGEIVWDTTRPNGQRRRILDTSRIRALGFKPATILYSGLEKTVGWYQSTRR